MAADDRLTLLDVMKRAGTSVSGLIDETTKPTPEVRLGNARPVAGTVYEQRIRVALPTVSFRDANEGSTASKSRTEKRMVECFIFNPRWEADVAVCNASPDGPEAVIAEEADAVLTASFHHLGKVFFYGTDTNFGDPKGFPGLLQTYDAANMTVDAGGTTDDVATSVWAVKFGPKDVRWAIGQNGRVALSDLRKESIADANGKRFTAYVQEILARIGMQQGHKASVARIKKITTDNGCGLTEDLLTSLMAKFPAGIMPDVIFMSKRSQGQLRNDISGKTITGRQAPLPTDFDGVPFAITGSIVDTEKLAL